jgi:Methylamine utilisation protein MauE
MLALTLYLVALLAASALHKLLARERLAAVAARLAGIALPSGALLLALAATLEALAALALLFPALRLGGALAAAALWLGYTAALWRQRGKVLDCGCDLVAREKPVDGLAIARPALLAVLAAIVAFGPAPVWTLDAPFAALALLALWFAAGELHSIPKLTRIRP